MNPRPHDNSAQPGWATTTKFLCQLYLVCIWSRLSSPGQVGPGATGRVGSSEADLRLSVDRLRAVRGQQRRGGTQARWSWEFYKRWYNWYKYDTIGPSNSSNSPTLRYSSIFISVFGYSQYDLSNNISFHIKQAGVFQYYFMRSKICYFYLWKNDQWKEFAMSLITGATLIH